MMSLFRILAVIAALVVVLMLAAQAGAIGNGVPDGDDHPNVGMTAGHCVDWLELEGVSPDQLWVTFDAETTFDPDTSAVLSTNTWHRASGVGFDHELGDYGVVLLDSVPTGLAPVRLATAGLLEEMTDEGALRPKTVFDNVGYGLMPSFKQ